MSDPCKHCGSTSVTYPQGHEGICCWTCGRSRTGNEWIDAVLNKARSEAIEECANEAHKLAEDADERSWRARQEGDFAARDRWDIRANEASSIEKNIRALVSRKDGE